MRLASSGVTAGTKVWQTPGFIVEHTLSSNSGDQLLSKGACKSSSCAPLAANLQKARKQVFVAALLIGHREGLNE